MPRSNALFLIATALAFSCASVDAQMQTGRNMRRYAEVLGLEHACPLFRWGRHRALVQDRSVDFPGEDVGDPDTLFSDFVVHKGPQGGLGKLGG